MMPKSSEWLYCQPTALRIIDANDDEMSDDALDLEGIQHDALCEDLLCQLEQECVSVLVSLLHAAEPAALASLC